MMVNLLIALDPSTWQHWITGNVFYTFILLIPTHILLKFCILWYFFNSFQKKNVNLHLFKNIKNFNKSIEYVKYRRKMSISNLKLGDIWSGASIISCANSLQNFSYFSMIRASSSTILPLFKLVVATKLMYTWTISFYIHYVFLYIVNVYHCTSLCFKTIIIFLPIISNLANKIGQDKLSIN